MDFLSMVKAAVELGIAPVLALFLVFTMHKEKKQLLAMIEKHEQNHLEIVKTLTEELAKFRTPPKEEQRVSRR